MTRRTVLALFLLTALMPLGAVVPAGAAPSWGPPTTLGPTARDNGSPDIAVAPDGEAVATWLGTRPDGIRVSTRRPGKGWSPPVTIASIGEEVQGPRIAVSDGKAVVVWSDNIRTRSGEARVILASTRLRGKRWSRPRNISAERRWREEPQGEEPQIVMTRRGKAIVVWSASDEGHSTNSFIGSAVQAARKTHWTAPVGIRGSYEGEEPQLAMTPTGEAVAIWGASYDEESNISVSSRPAKGPWEAARQLSTPGTFPQLQLAVTPRGEAVGAWVQEPEEGFGTVIQVATRPSGGKWKVKTLEPQDFGGGPEIVTEPGGRARVVWVKGASSEKQEIVTSTHSPGGEWTKAVSLTAEGPQPPIEAPLEMAVTGAGESIAVWSNPGFVGESLTVRASSKPGGQPWTESTDIFTSPAMPLYGAPDLQLAIAPDGEAFAVWRCFNGARWEIRAATRPSAG